jgi:uncharacterized protein YbaP (TraB family)
MSFLRNFRRIASIVGVASVTLAGAAHADPALWVIKGPQATVYLFGTVHALKPGQTWRSAKLDAALTASDEVWLEVDDVQDKAAIQAIAQQQGLDPTHKLSDKLNPADQAALSEAAKRLGVPVDKLETMRPWLAWVAVNGAGVKSSGADIALGVESTFESQAKASGKPVHGLETAQEQFAIFAGLPEAVQLNILHEALADAGRPSTVVDKLGPWLEGDVEGVDRVMLADMRRDEPAIYKTMLADRNARWAKRIAEMARGKGVIFIAVGAGHLAGPDSVQAKLAKAGVEVKRL